MRMVRMGITTTDMRGTRQDQLVVTATLLEYALHKTTPFR